MRNCLRSHDEIVRLLELSGLKKIDGFCDNRQFSVRLTVRILTQFGDEVCQAAKNLLQCKSNEQSKLESKCRRFRRAIG